MKEASLGSRWEQIQRLTMRHYTQSLNSRSPLGPSSQGSGNLSKEEGIVGVKRNGGNKENMAQ